MRNPEDRNTRHGLAIERNVRGVEHVPTLRTGKLDTAVKNKRSKVVTFRLG